MASCDCLKNIEKYIFVRKLHDAVGRKFVCVVAVYTYIHCKWFPKPHNLYSLQCAAAVRDAFRTIDKMLEQGNNSQLAIDFNSCAPIKYHLDIYQFVSNLADVIMGTVQYNMEDIGVDGVKTMHNDDKKFHHIL